METQNIEMKNETVNLPQIEGVPVGGSARSAFERRFAEIQAVPGEQLTRPPLDPHGAVATVLGALPAIRALREGIAGLPGLKADLVDRLEDYAWALQEACARHDHTVDPGEGIGALFEEAVKARETFRLDAVALAHRGLIEKERLDSFKGLTGYKNVAFDLMDWAFVMRECWAKIQGKSGLTAAEIDAAAELGERLLAQASLRDQQAERVAAAALVRQQALVLLARTYDEVRRALTFLRWEEDDVESIAPSLFQRYGRRVRAKAEEEQAAVPPTAPPPAPEVTLPHVLNGAEPSGNE